MGNSTFKRTLRGMKENNSQWKRKQSLLKKGVVPKNTIIRLWMMLIIRTLTLMKDRYSVM
jgi:hypothetical protein